METFINILLFGVLPAAGVITTWFLLHKTNLKQREQLCKEWKVGDKLIVNSTELDLALQRANQEYGILSGCNLENVFIEIGDVVYCRKWFDVKTNKSYNWRVNYQKCQEAMGTNPTFSYEVKEPSEKTSVSGTIDGKAIELLTEIECQIYLKQALEEENFEMAEKIRKQMEKYR
jgi:hypothetical protein